MKRINYIIAGLDNLTLFSVISICLILNNYFINKLIYDDYILYNTIDNQLSTDHITRIVYLIKKWNWIGYILIPIILFIKICLISFCIEVGVIFKSYKLDFKNIFKVVLIAESVFLVAQFIRTLTLCFLDFKTLDEIQYFYPLSVLNLFDPENLAIWLVYPLQKINLFMLAYFLLLAYSLSIFIKKNFIKMLSFTFGTYGICLLIWVMLVMFINVNYL